MSSDPPRRVRRAAEVVHRVIDGEAVLLDLQSQRYFGLNATGSVIWESLGAAGATADDLVRVICERFDVTREVARDDIDELLARLAAERLVHLE